MCDFAKVTLAEALRITREYKRVAAVCGVSPRRPYKWAAEVQPLPIPDKYEEPITDVLESIPGGTATVLREIAELLEKDAAAREDGKFSVLEAADIREACQRGMFALEIEAREAERKAGGK